MPRHILSRQHHRERGQTILFVALAMVSLLGMAALAIDVVTLYVARSEAQRAADATALAAAQAVANSGFTTLPTNDIHYTDGTAQALAQSMATAAISAMTSAITPNLIAGVPPQVVGSPAIDLSHQGDARITLTLSRSNLPTFFSKIWGRGVASVTATAAAEAYNPANQNPFTPISPTSVKPWLVANVDPLNPAPNTPFVNTGTGGIETGVIGETFNLTADCAVAGVACAPPHAPGIASTGANAQVEYVPMHVFANAKNVCPGCAGATDYEQSIECADANTYVTPSCGGGLPNAVWDNGVNPRAGGSGSISALGAECLIHASATGSGAGQDLLIEPLIVFSGAMQIKAQSGPQNGNFVITSNSVVTIPIIDTVGFPIGGGAVTVVGYIQAFINQVNDATGGKTPGDINITVLNIAGCGPNPNGASPVVGGDGTSPVPVRLISPP